MIELHGQIAPVRLHGQLNKVPSESSGGPLQSKTAWPSHSQQIITPDDDYYGLASVKVEPVPRVPACVASVIEGADYVVDIMVPCATEITVAGEHFVQTHALYNGVRLPLIPADVLAAYPFAWIGKVSGDSDYRLYFATGKWWYDAAATIFQDNVMYRTVSETAPVYRYNTETDKWEHLSDSSGSVTEPTVIWANFNVPKDSASATTYYKTATEPGITI